MSPAKRVINAAFRAALPIGARSLIYRLTGFEALEKVASGWDEGYSQGASPAGRQPNPYRTTSSIKGSSDA